MAHPTPVSATQPKTLDELQHLVRTQPNLRAFAAQHSGELWPAELYIDMNGFNRVLAVTADTVTCEAGVEIKVLLEHLAPLQRTISTVPSVLRASIGGVILTGSHGSGQSTLSNQVLTLTFVLADGTLRTLTPTDPDFKYAVVSAGLLGILYSCQLRTIPAYNLYQRRWYTKFPTNWLEWLVGGLNRQFFYNPYRRKVLLYDQSLTPVYGPNRKSLTGLLIDNGYGEQLAQRVYNQYPQAIPDFINLAYRALSGVTSGSGTEVLSIYEYDVPILDFELAVPVTQAVATLRQLDELVEHWRRDHGYYLWFGVLFRYLKRDVAVLSQSYDGDVVTLAFPLYPSEQSVAFVKDVQLVLGRNFHIGKYTGAPLSAHPRWAEFDQVRRRFDPSNRFLSTTML